jgi:hypothetical protein
LRVNQLSIKDELVTSHVLRKLILKNSHLYSSETDPPLEDSHALILSQNSMRIPINSKPTKINQDPGVKGVIKAIKPMIIKKTPIIFLPIDLTI